MSDVHGGDPGAAGACPTCGASIGRADAFCEACGAELVAGAAERVRDEHAAVAVPRRPCAACGAAVLDDGFCGACGTKAPTERDHWSEHPAPGVGGVCDRGIVHARNEDAMALAAAADRPFAVLVVCDGVTSAPDSDRASLAAARRACAELAAVPSPTGGDAARVAHWSAAMSRAAVAANDEAVGIAHALGDPAEPPSSTFAAAVADGPLLVIGWIGDSRAYWFADGGTGEQLTVDHSLGTEMIRAGATRAEAEADPASHTITRWLGADSVSATAEIVTRRVDVAGWLLVCSDGVWNYASEPAALWSVMAPVAVAGPVAIADALVRWANDHGGHDNATAALARVDPSLV